MALSSPHVNANEEGVIWGEGKVNFLHIFGLPVQHAQEVSMYRFQIHWSMVYNSPIHKYFGWIINLLLAVFISASSKLQNM